MGIFCEQNTEQVWFSNWSLSAHLLLQLGAIWGNILQRRKSVSSTTCWTKLHFDSGRMYYQIRKKEIYFTPLLNQAEFITLSLFHIYGKIWMKIKWIFGTLIDVDTLCIFKTCFVGKSKFPRFFPNLSACIFLIQWCKCNSLRIKGITDKYSFGVSNVFK